MIATLAGSCFVAVTQIVTLSPNELTGTLRLAVGLFAFATPLLAVASFKVPAYSDGGSKTQLWEALFFLFAVLSAFFGFICLFWHFGALTGFVFIFGAIAAAVAFYLHGVRQ